MADEIDTTTPADSPSPADITSPDEAFFDEASAPAAPEVKPEPKPEAKAEPAKPDRPRGPDGKFLPKEPEKPSHPEWTVRLAKRFGLTDEYIGRVSPETLGEVVDNLAAYQAQRPQQPTQQQVQQEQQEQALQFLDPDFEKEWEPDLVKHVKTGLERLYNHFEQKFKAQENAAFQQSHTSKTDEALSKASPEIFGTGPIAQLSDEEKFARRFVHDYVKQYKMNEPGSFYEKLEYYGKKYSEKLRGPAAKKEGYEAPSPTALSKDQEAWLQAGLPKPTHRNGTAELPGIEKAKRTFLAGLAARNGHSNGASEHDELPG